MKWFKVYISSEDVPIEAQKKLFRDFFKLLIDKEFPTELAMHFSIDNFDQSSIRYFSAPDDHCYKLKSFFEGFIYQEVTPPNLDKLKTIIGELE